MNAKVALLLFGHMRTYQDCFQSLKTNLIGPLNPDIFIHTWNEIESSTISWHKLNMDRYAISNDEEEHIKSLYCPKKIKFENQKDLSSGSETLINGMSMEGQKFMMYSLFKANEMKKKYEVSNNMTYDVVIKLRPDVLLKDPITKILKKNQYDDNEVTLCGNKVKLGKGIASYRALDVISISNSKTMDLVASIYNESDDYLSRELYKHSTFIDYLIENDIDISISKYNYQNKWIIKRST